MLFADIAVPVVDAGVPWAPIVAAVAQFPLIALFFIALQRGWIEIGVVAKRERGEKDAQLTFREELRQEGLKREAAGLAREDELVDKLGGLSEALKEATDVMERSTAFNERLLDRHEARGGEEPSAPEPTRRSRRAPQGSAASSRRGTSRLKDSD